MEIRSDDTEMYNGNFDYYLEINNKREQTARQAVEAENKAKAEQEYKEKNERAYKSKEQRSLEAKRRARVRELETLIEEKQSELDNLQEEITREEVYSNFEVMNKKCTNIEQLKNEIDEMFDEIVELS